MVRESRKAASRDGAAEVPVRLVVVMVLVGMILGAVIAPEPESVVADDGIQARLPADPVVR
jgi:hypothetical protein